MHIAGSKIIQKVSAVSLSLSLCVCIYASPNALFFFFSFPPQDSRGVGAILVDEKKTREILKTLNPRVLERLTRKGAAEPLWLVSRPAITLDHRKKRALTLSAPNRTTWTSVDQRPLKRSGIKKSTPTSPRESSFGTVQVWRASQSEVGWHWR